MYSTTTRTGPVFEVGDAVRFRDDATNPPDLVRCMTLRVVERWPVSPLPDGTAPRSRFGYAVDAGLTRPIAGRARPGAGMSDDEQRLTLVHNHVDPAHTGQVGTYDDAYGPSIRDPVLMDPNAGEGLPVLAVNHYVGGVSGDDAELLRDVILEHWGPICTTYAARRAERRAVLDVINEAEGWTDADAERVLDEATQKQERRLAGYLSDAFAAPDMDVVNTDDVVKALHGARLVLVDAEEHARHVTSTAEPTGDDD